MNDAPEVVKQILDMYADDTTLQASDSDITSLQAKLNHDLSAINQWFIDNRLVLNTDKTVSMLLATHQRLATVKDTDLNFKVGDKDIQQVKEAKLLGVTIDPHLNWDKHISKLCNKISRKLGLLKRLKKFMPNNTLHMLYNSIVLPHFDYANVVWGTACGTNLKQVYRLQKRAARIITGAKRFSSTHPLFQQLNWMPLAERVQFHTAVLTFKALKGSTPEYLSSKFVPTANRHQHSTRLSNTSDLKVPKPNLEIYRRSFEYRGAVVWNSISQDTRKSISVSGFKAGYIRTRC